MNEYDGRLTIEYRSGWEGLYGYVRIAMLDGTLTVGAEIADRIPSACPDDPSHAETNGRLGNFALMVDDPVECQPPPE